MTSETRVRPRLADPFADEDGAAEQYRTMKWWHVGILMVAETISLGVLSLPRVVADVGLVPAITLIIVLGTISAYNGYVIGQFKLAFPGTMSFADAGFEIAGVWGREILTIASALVLVCISAAHILSFSIMLDVLTDFAACSIAYAVVGFLACFVLGMPRTMKRVSHLCISSCLSVLLAVLVAMIGIARVKPDSGNIEAVAATATLPIGVRAGLNIIIAYAGHVGFFGFISELSEPREFPKALLFMQTLSTSFYIVTGVVIYYFAGPTVLSPALGSASPIVRKVAFGLAAPTIIIGGCINGHLVCKMIYLRIWRRDVNAYKEQQQQEEQQLGAPAQPAEPASAALKHHDADASVSGEDLQTSRIPTTEKDEVETGNSQQRARETVASRARAEESVLHKKDFKALGSWYALDFAVWALSWVIAESIPNFNLMLALISSLLGAWFSFGLTGILYLYMNKGALFTSKSRSLLTLLNVCIVLLGVFACVAGLWATTMEISAGGGGQVFSCKSQYAVSGGEE